MRRNQTESQEPRRESAGELRAERGAYPEPEVPDEVEAWDLDDVMDLLPDSYE